MTGDGERMANRDHSSEKAVPIDSLSWALGLLRLLRASCVFP